MQSNSMETPNYRIKISVYDDNTAEEVGFVDEPMMNQNSDNTDAIEDDNQPTFFRAMRKFHSERSDFEATHYPKEETSHE